MSAKEQEEFLTSRNKNQFIRNGGSVTEKSPFLHEPVRLTPAWEANNLPNDELNFKSMTMERVKMEMSPPRDKYRIVYYIFLLHGLGILMPWNMFITAKGYFVNFKLHSSYIGNVDLSYSTYFLSYIGFAAQIPNFLFNWINIYIKFGGNLTTRIVWSLCIEILIFIITIILAMVDSSAWPDVFFWSTVGCVVVLNMANGIFQNTVFGMAATLPIKYTGAVILGSNISGLFATVLSMLSNFIFPTRRTAAIYYFITALFVLLICFDTYFALPLNKFFRYHEMLKENEKAREEKSMSKVSYRKVFKESSLQLFNIFMIFFVTLTIFPAIHSDIKKVEDDVWFPIPAGDAFRDITCFFTFNLFAMLGSLLTSWVQWPNAKTIIIPVLLRLVFIPLFVFCNYQPEKVLRVLPIYIESNWTYWVLSALVAFSSGYLSSLAMMYASQSVQPKYAQTAGMFASAMLITGIISGILFSYVFPELVANISW